MKTVKKITKATFKSYVKKYKDDLFIKVTSRFDGMHDCCMSQSGGWIKAIHDCKRVDHSLGIRGCYLVGNSRDYFSFYEDEFYTGIEVYNSCGTFIIGIKKT